MDAQRVVQELSTALSNDDLWSHPEIVDDVEKLADAYDELEAENAKFRELVTLMDKRDVLLPCWRGCDAFCRFYGSHCERIGTLMGELGFEVES